MLVLVDREWWTLPTTPTFLPMRLIETPADFAELMKECQSQVKWYVDYAKDRCGLYMPYPKVLFSLKGTTAGRAFYHEHTIKFNPTLLRENPDTFLEQTTGHEVSHLVAFRLNNEKIDPHGREWRVVMLKMGLPPNRCHNYDTSRVPSKLGRVANNRPQTTYVSNLGAVKTFGIGKMTELD
jgi:predicted SprT family Zn-dependent metalloprotease